MSKESAGNKCIRFGNVVDDITPDLTSGNMHYNVLSVKCMGTNWYPEFEDSYMDFSSLMLLLLMGIAFLFISQIVKDLMKHCIKGNSCDSSYLTICLFALNLIVQSICIVFAGGYYLNRMNRLGSFINDWNEERTKGSCGFSIFVSILLFKPFFYALSSGMLTIADIYFLINSGGFSLGSIGQLVKGQVIMDDVINVTVALPTRFIAIGAAIFVGFVLFVTLFPLLFYGIGVILIFIPILLTILALMISCILLIAIFLLMLLIALNNGENDGIEVINKKSTEAIKCFLRSAILIPAMLVSFVMYFSLYYIHDCGWEYLSQKFFLGIFWIDHLDLDNLISWPVSLSLPQRWNLAISLTSSGLSLAASLIFGTSSTAATATETVGDAHSSKHDRVSTESDDNRL